MTAAPRELPEGAPEREKTGWRRRSGLDLGAGVSQKTRFVPDGGKRRRASHSWNRGVTTVPNKASAAKRARQNVKRRVRNRAARSTMKSAVKTALDSIAQNQNPTEAVKNAQSVVGHMVKRGVVNHRRAARMTSRLMKRANKAASAAKG